MSRKVLIGGIVVIAIVLGALREFLFLNLNYAIDHLANHRTVSYAHSAFRAAIDGWSLGGLRSLKWIFSAFFIGTNLLLALGLSRILFGDHRYRKLLILAFLGIAAFAFVLNMLGRNIPGLGDVAVKLLHVLQYPVMLFFLWAATWLGAAPHAGRAG
ncbi:MAG TPA: hypothetical protein PLV08_02620 [Flavobacteriales bacterium]|nr:hypothetical protein [Flavobacteriales bacterium]MBK7111847.1 hypothetical protein [Flavobacteriales bacterium]MBP8877663.1 hypothetical protein [Flavobacteriales bacterium]MBP9178326.1 hypothetical protein [Flavobacteriales bacterium]HQX98643.1 hypothetical protein [Flavobacteriales bacterium]